ncbi:hypothetical protein Fmac_032527 [Flemingia macrophylla]|uniref:Uncharacterized protein n=1 Tax=Flemingia macrophylla TaxID=520843 RepID=A0ABD1L567_9FABA
MSWAGVLGLVGNVMFGVLVWWGILVSDYASDVGFVKAAHILGKRKLVLL